jgi:hypothetical protein
MFREIHSQHRARSQGLAPANWRVLAMTNAKRLQWFSQGHSPALFLSAAMEPGFDG